MDQTAQYPVYTGVWTNWSNGAVLGGTLTLTRNDATLFISFIAFFAAWVGTCFWRIACLALHFLSSTSRPRAGLHHQQQAVLRNAADPESGLRLLAALLWAWRGRAGRASLARVAGLVLVSAACIAGFAVASLYTSRISTSDGNEVLLRGANCSVRGKATRGLGGSGDDDPYESYLFKHMQQRATDIENSANYALQCYSATGVKQLSCGTFVNRRLPVRADMRAPCPFEEAICRSTDRNLVLDTGYLDSHDQLGINARPEERFLYRRVMQCAPLVTEGYKETFNVSATQSKTRYLYGGAYLGATDNNRNRTYIYSNDASDDLSRLDYTLGVRKASYENGTLTSDSAMSPIPQLTLNRTDADILLVFLSSNAIIFNHLTTDPWYNGTQLQVIPTSFFYRNGSLAYTRNYTQYVAAELASPLACRVQDQFCASSGEPDDRDKACGPLATPIDAVDAALPRFEQGKRAEWENRLGWFAAVLGERTLVNPVVESLGSHALLARFSLSRDGTQGDIPDNQWMLDAQHWLEISLASIQGAVVAAANGPSNPIDLELPYVKPNATEELSMCVNQKILSDLHTSFSLLGLILTFSLGTLIILTSYLLDPTLTCLQRRRRVREYQRLEWCANGVLQLQRLAHEGIGSGGGPWDGSDGDVPMPPRRRHAQDDGEKGRTRDAAADEVMLAPLDVAADRTHPTLVRDAGLLRRLESEGPGSPLSDSQETVVVSPTSAAGDAVVKGNKGLTLITSFESRMA